MPTNDSITPASSPAYAPLRQEDHFTIDITQLRSEQGSSSETQVQRDATLRKKRRAKELATLLVNIPKYSITNDAKNPISVTGTVFPQDRFLPQALQEFNAAHDELTQKLNGGAESITSEEATKLELKFLTKAAHAVRAAVAYSGETNNANNRRQDFSWASSASNIATIIQSRAPILLAPLAVKFIHSIGYPDTPLANKAAVAATLAAALPIAGRDAHHRYSESGMGAATKTNFDLSGGIRRVGEMTGVSSLVGRFTPPPQAPGPAHWGTGALAMGLVMGLSLLGQVISDRNPTNLGAAPEDSWQKSLAQTAIMTLGTLMAVSFLEAVKQTAIAVQNDRNGDGSAQMAERMDHRRNQSDVFISQTTFKSLRSRTQGIPAVDTPRGRARLIQQAGSIAAGVVAGALYKSPGNLSAFGQSALGFLAASITKWGTETVATHLLNHPKRHPEHASLATTQIRVDDIRNSAMQAYTEFSVSLANGLLTSLKSEDGISQPAKELLYKSHLPQANNAETSNQASSNRPELTNISSAHFDTKAFAATSFLFDTQKLKSTEIGPDLNNANKKLRSQIALFKNDFDTLKAGIHSSVSERSNHLKRQIDYIDKSLRSCDEMLERLESAIHDEFQLTGDRPNAQARTQGLNLYLQAREAMKNLDPSDVEGREAIKEQQNKIASFCCGSLECDALTGMDLSKIPNDALGVALVAVRETLKAELYDLHTRSMLLASNLTMENYLDKAGLGDEVQPTVQGDGGGLPQALESALYKLLPIHTALVDSDFEEMSKDFLGTVASIPSSFFSDSDRKKGQLKSKAFHVLSRESGLRPSMVKVADMTNRRLSSPEGSRTHRNGQNHLLKLKNLRKDIDKVGTDVTRKAGNFAASTFKGNEMRVDGIDVARVKTRLDLALNLIQPGNFSQDHGALLASLDKFASDPSESLNILSRADHRSQGSPVSAVVKEDFVDQLKAAFKDMTHEGQHKLGVDVFLQKLHDGLSKQPEKLEELKNFILKELPETRDFFKMALGELSYVVGNPFEAVSTDEDIVTIDATVPSTIAEPIVPPETEMKLIETQLQKLRESLSSVDGDVKNFWDGLMSTPVQESAKELELYKLADTHRHQSAFANQHENLFDSYHRMKKVGVHKSVIMPIPTILNNGGQMIDYYTSGTYGISYSPSPKDQREGITRTLSQGAALMPNASGENALIRQLGDLFKERASAQQELDGILSTTDQLSIEDVDSVAERANELRAKVEVIDDVFGFYVLSSTIADTGNANKKGMEEQVLGQFAKSKDLFGSYLIKMMGENTFNKTNVNSRQPVDTDRDAVKNAIMIAAQLSRPFNLHSDAAKPGDKQTWFTEVENLLREVVESTNALDDVKSEKAEREGVNDARLASNFKVIWSHAGGIAADARDSVDHLFKLRNLMNDETVGKHLLVDISWDKTYSVAMKNFQDYLDIQKNDLKVDPSGNSVGQLEEQQVAQTKENLKTVSRLFESLSFSMDNFSSGVTKAHLAHRHGLSQTAAFSRVASSTPFDLHKQQLANFKGQFESLFKTDPGLRKVFVSMIGDAPSQRNNNWVGFMVNHSDQIMFGTDALVPHTKITGEMQYQMNALNYYPFFNMIDVMSEYYSEDGPGNIVEDGGSMENLRNLERATDNITFATFERLMDEQDYAGGDEIIDAYLSDQSNRRMATANDGAILEAIYTDTLVSTPRLPTDSRSSTSTGPSTDSRSSTSTGPYFSANSTAYFSANSD
ncbi:hypothetical protein [uncultured Tateyamaria sp.]|uniref:hypothetical protein n=1 Tax=uncultured Tateyamaria sp. TaxID=455651 RepID=UPI0026291FB4|nr:hypothetical protein [uncultured Tateyamaria sp.]